MTSTCVCCRDGEVGDQGVGSQIEDGELGYIGIWGLSDWIRVLPVSEASPLKPPAPSSSSADRARCSVVRRPSSLSTLPLRSAQNDADPFLILRSPVLTPYLVFAPSTPSTRPQLLAVGPLASNGFQRR